MFKYLNTEEIEAHQKWARENYKPFDTIMGTWHPVIQFTCMRMNAEAGYEKSEPCARHKRIIPINKGPLPCQSCLRTVEAKE